MGASLIIRRHGCSHVYVTFKFSYKVPTSVIHSDNKDEKVTAVEVYKKGFEQMSTEMTL